MKIDSKDFEISAFIVENLTCHIIIGNNFLYNHKAIINVCNNTLTLDNSITTQTNTNFSKGNIHNIKEEIVDMFQVDSKGIASQMKIVFGDTAPQLAKSKPQIGDAVPTNVGNKIIYHLVTKQKYFHKPTYEDIKLTIQNLKKMMRKLRDFKIAIPTIAAGLDKCNLTITKQLIFSEFQNTNIDLLICHKNKNTHN